MPKDTSPARTPKENDGFSTKLIPDFLPLITATASALAGLVILCFLLIYADRGFDFTDEGFYLVRIAHPFSDGPAISQFGLIYHPVYLLLDGSIASLRRFNILTTYLLGGLLSYLVFAKFLTLNRVEGESRHFLQFLTATGIGSVALASFDLLLITPNYNTLCFQGLMIAAIGLLLASREVTLPSLAGWLLISVGGWLVFFAKPSSAGILAVIVLFYIFAAAKFQLMLVVGSALAALLLTGLTAVFLDGSPVEFIKRIQFGLERAALLEGGHTLKQIFRWDDLPLADGDAKLILSILAISAAVFLLTSARHRWASRLGFALSLLIAAYAISIVAGLIAGPAFRNASAVLLFLGPLSALVLLTVVQRAATLWRNDADPPSASDVRSRWAIAGMLVVLPFAFAFGTASNYWSSGLPTALFAGLAGLVLLAPRLRRPGGMTALVATALCLQAVTAIIVNRALDEPYRQPSTVRNMDAAAAVGPQNSRLILTGPFAEYLSALRRLFRDAGFVPGTPVIDLTGQSPGALYAIGADNIGQAWMIGSYKGSADVARIVLSRQSCTSLGRSWLLLEPEGPRSISVSVLAEIGLRLAEGYERVGELETPPGAGGYDARRKQSVYKPSRSIERASADCELTREGSKG